MLGLDECKRFRELNETVRSAGPACAVSFGAPSCPHAVFSLSDLVSRLKSSCCAFGGRTELPLTGVRAAVEREALCFPMAFPVKRRTQPEEEAAEEEEREGSSQSGSVSSGRSGSQKSKASKLALRHRILGESFLEARPPNGDLLYEKYLILSRDTKEPLITVQRRGGGVSFVDVDTAAEIGSFHILQENLWRCSMFEESEDFNVEPSELSAGINLSLSPFQMHADKHHVKLPWKVPVVR